MQRTAILSLVSLLSVAACAGSDVGSGADYATDSWAKPTMHGELSFELSNQAEFSGQERYHGWTFELSGDAHLSLKTVLGADNLDTALFLYRRDSSDENWGSYIAKSDDHGDDLWSLVDDDFAAGQYLVKVRAAKESFRGKFSLDASCDGRGCPKTDVCDASSVYAWPASSDATPACTAKFQEVLLAPVTRTFSASTTIPEKCELGAVAAQAIDLYKAYWEDFIGWDDFTGGDGEEPTLYVEIDEHGDSGTVVRVDIGGDEDLLSFVFDAQGELVAFHHSEQSPSAGFFCPGTGQGEEAVPECVGAALWNLPHEAGSVTSASGSSSVDGSGQLPAAVQKTLRYFQAQQAGVASSDPIAYDYELWSGDAEGLRIELSAGGVTLSYTAAFGYDSYIVVREEGGQAQLVCAAIPD